LNEIVKWNGEMKTKFEMGKIYMYSISVISRIL